MGLFGGISPDRISSDWGFMVAAGGSAGGGVVVSVELVYLINVRDQMYFPGRLMSVGVGAGIGIRGISAGNLQFTFFRTDVPLRASDFAGFVTLAGAEAIGGDKGVQQSYITFWGVHHDPYWIDVAGFSFGMSAGASASLLCSCHFFDDPRRVTGSWIGPGGRNTLD